jgi:PAS domain S-box-containing protein
MEIGLLRKWFDSVSIKEKLYFVIGIMAFLIAAELIILYFTIHTLSATRAFVGGEGLYSKAQKEAAYHLREYAFSGNETDYLSYQKFIHICEGDRKARLELEKEKPDEEQVYQGFLQGRNNRNDIEGMIYLFKRFRHVSYIDKAVSYWRGGDSLIELYGKVAIQLHLLANNAPSANTPVERSQLVNEMNVLNAQLTVLEDDFSYTLGEGSRWLEGLIMKMLLSVALTVELTGLFLTVSVSRGITRGLNEIMKASVNVGQSDFSHRAVVHTQDELGELATSFNRMVDQLQQKTEAQKQAEETLRRQKELYETLVVAQSEMGEGVIITEEESIVFANRALCQMYGYSEEELLSIPSYHLLVAPPDKVRLKLMSENRQAGNEEPTQGETSVIRKDGRIIDIAYSRKMIETGKKTQIISIVRDITDQKVFEKKMEELAAIVQASDDAIATLSLGGSILNWNKGAEKLFGYTAGEMIGKPVSILSLPGETDAFMHLVNKIRNGEIVDHFESQSKRKNGQLLSISTTASSILNKSGIRVAIAIIARDISESKQTALALQLKSEELVRSNTELEQFAYIISHDLREPLRTISSYIQLLSERYPDKLDADAKEFIGHALGGTKRMDDLINDLLTYSRAGFSTIQFEQIDCKEIIETVLGNLQESIRSKEAEITCENLPPRVYASRSQMIQLFQNLIGNAIKFTSGVIPKVSITAKSTGHGWQFTVSDNGIGVAEKFAKRVFVIFQRLHGVGEYEGTGIGLAICKKIVERHGGEIWCDSVPGKGAAFSFTINPPSEALSQPVL